MPRNPDALASPCSRCGKITIKSDDESDLTDAELLRRFVKGAEQSAFTALVRRHGPLVRAVAQRVLVDPALVDEASQAAFLALHRKSQDLVRHACLGAWLHRTTVLCARNVQRREAREQRKRQEFARAAPPEAAEQNHWIEARPHLDAAINELDEKDLVAVVGRYFEGKSLADT